MNLLILGYSSIAQRRVIPAAKAIDAIARIDVASRTRVPAGDLSRRHYPDYGSALRQSDAELVYVSLPNAAHFETVQLALEAGKHVIVDKPACLTLKQARACVEVARRRNLLLAEATVFAFHPQISGLRDFFKDNGPLTHMDACFVIPPLPAENFRNSASLGGGCLLDMGPYAAALARIFANSPLQELHAVAAPPSPELDIDMGFSLLARFENGTRYSGHFSFESEYRNELLLVGRRGSVAVERIFSPPPDHACTWQQRVNNRVERGEWPPADTFRLFMEAAISAIERRDFQTFADDLLTDAGLRAAIAGRLGMEEP